MVIHRQSSTCQKSAEDVLGDYGEREHFVITHSCLFKMIWELVCWPLSRLQMLVSPHIITIDWGITNHLRPTAVFSAAVFLCFSHFWCSSILVWQQFWRLLNPYRTKELIWCSLTYFQNNNERLGFVHCCHYGLLSALTAKTAQGMHAGTNHFHWAIKQLS